MQINTLIPSFIINAHDQGEIHGRFTAVALQADISGFTYLTNSIMEQNRDTGGELVENLMRSLFTPLIEHAHRFGGFVGMFAGDAFTAFFPYQTNDPANQERVAHRALTAAWHMEQTIKQISSKQDLTEFKFGIKIGLGCGPIHWRIFPAAVPENVSHHTIRTAYTFAGEGLSDAIQALDHCQNQELICSRVIQEQTRPFATFTPTAVESDFFQLNAIQQEAAEDGRAQTPSNTAELYTPFVPAPLREKREIGEFRQVVSLFIGIQASISDLAELEPLANAIYDLQAAYGGYLNALRFGDKGGVAVMFWGAPVSLERDVQLATQFAYRLQQESPFPLRIGLSYRWLYSGLIGADSRQDYTCYGGGTSFAARLMTSADDGEILLDSTVASRISAQFELVPLGKRPMKGFAEQQEVYRLSHQIRDEKSSFYYQQAFVGRQPELAQLSRFVGRLFTQKQFGTFTLRGDAGSGKSRLVHELQQQISAQEDQPFLWCLCQADELVKSDLNAIRYYLQRFFEQSPEVSDVINKERFATQYDTLQTDPRVTELTADLEMAKSFLGSLLGLFWTDSLYGRFPPQQRQEEIQRSLITFFKALCHFAPVIIQIEDTHWLDTPSQQLFQQLLTTLHATPEQLPHGLILIQTTREMAPQNGALDSTDDDEGLAHEELEIGRLSTGSAAQFINQLLDKPAAPSLIELLVDRTDGNPFFLEQTVLYWHEVGLLYEDEQVTKAKRDEGVISSDIRAVLLARIDRLLPNVRETVQTAAVLGHEFSLNVLRWMLQYDPNIDEHISGATDSSIWLQLQELRYLFKHSLLRDVAYQMQLQQRRRHIHEVALNAMEAVYQADLTPYLGELALHAEQSGQVGKAIDYLTKAGDAAADTYQNESALAYYGRGFAYLNQEPETSTAYSKELIALALKTARTLHFVDRVNEIPQILNPAAILAQEQRWNTEIGELLLHYAKSYLWQGKYLLATSYIQHSLAIAIESKDNTLQSKALYERGAVSWFQGDYAKALVDAQKAIDAMDHTTSNQQKSELYNFWALSELFIGSYANALKGFEQSLVIERLLQRDMHTANVLQNIGTLYLMMGEYQQSADYHQQAYQLLELFDVKRLSVRVTGNWGYVLIQLGQTEEGWTHLEKALQISLDFNLDYDVCAIYLYKAQVYFQNSAYDDAIESNNEALAFATKINNQDFVIQCQLLSAQIYKAQQAIEPATIVLDSIEVTQLNTGQLGDYYYTRWYVLGEKTDAQNALKQYLEIVEAAPKITYTARIAELTSLGLG